MSIEDRLKAASKNIEGKAQEAMGNLTGDPQQQAEGQIKQAEAAVGNTVENIKDDFKENID